MCPFGKTDDYRWVFGISIDGAATPDVATEMKSLAFARVQYWRARGSVLKLWLVEHRLHSPGFLTKQGSTYSPPLVG